ncbi:hypothetical protein [Yinghuangia seranimata]|uniref:hypothetical protein n=1 Tax=Yinghuangia seranimata TaxID=408067 RepID=UPI00248CFA76|nr:hypothetical protein [Yinghuangia seranimata]MDI2130410.1 hypothetical protein [Yinghuangia seranimata]
MDDDRWVRDAVEQARPVWEGGHDHQEFGRYVNGRPWSPIQAIAVIREVQQCTLREAIDRYQAYQDRMGRG